MPRYLKSDLLCLLTATIWGFAFVAQRVGMDHVGPFTFNGIRFLLGALVLVPFIRRNRGRSARQPARHFPGSQRKLLFYGSLAGLALFGGASLQQVGLVYTTAGNAGFITGLYVVLVPIMGLLWGQRTNAGTWLGALMAAIGLYLLSIKSGFTISFGDFLELLGALLWAAHIHLIGWMSPKTDALPLAFVQFMVCALASLATAVGVETASVARIAAASTAILYGGVLSVGVAYTLQVVAQRDAHPAHAAILLCLESVFAAVGGWLVLDEVMAGRAMIGCVLMLAGMLVSQLYGLVTHRSQSNT
ncbi:transporter [Desulfosarcina ovata subsp. sediminis]|uniref:Transporter n=1 Tax=Desulfosarcina ovata subsp. sediminis TaxID=885957 RepID=A0A5K7ZVR9_9BACT|nr:DMT family transporter [Desulfosarcina ovata]BBO84290.1 transporter [Desulfosarcina ovata subsp. sediminis]